EYMKVMGLKGWLHWIAHFITSYIKVVIIVIINVIFLSMLAKNSNPFLLLLFFLLYAMNVVWFAFAVAAVRATAVGAATWAALGWLGLFVMHIVVQLNYSSYGLIAKLAWSLNPNIAMACGVKIMTVFEYTGDMEGLNFSNLFKQIVPEDKYTMAHAFLMLIVGQIICIIFCWYVEAVFPGGEAVPEKPWFFLQPSYYFPRLANKSGTNHSQSVPAINVEERSAGIEPDPPGLDISVDVRGLSKTWGLGIWKTITSLFGKEKSEPAVCDLSIKLFRGQVTALLGHNGAGKSTTFAMLSGMTQPTHGDAFIEGYDLRSGLSKIREHLGLCPQYNALFPNLTVSEHLELFCKLKGRAFDKQEMINLLTSLNLADKISALTKTLSGGMKRKLCLAIALIGGSEIIMLDEPTSGMDPNARHETWHLLQRLKSERTILLTTHYMEEADLLGDRIAILVRGKIECLGTPLFLKNLYGAGYHITAAFMDASKVANGKEDILSILKSQCASAQLQATAGSEATFLISTIERPKFPALFAQLERAKDKLGVEAFGVSVTTMEEVFLKVGDIVEERIAKEANPEALTPDVSELNVEQIGSDNMGYLKDSDTFPAGQEWVSRNKARNKNIEFMHITEKQTGPRLFFVHMQAMFIKRFIFFTRNWRLMIPQLIIPLVGLLLTLLAIKLISTTSSTAEPPLTLDLSIYSSPVATIIGDEASMASYKSAANGAVVQEYPEPNDMGTIILQGYAKDTIPVADRKYVVGAEMNSSGDVVMWYNGQPYHAAPIALSLVDTVLLRRATDNDNYRITVTNAPLPPAKVELNDGTTVTNADSYAFCLVLMIVIGLVVGAFANIIIRERISKVRHMLILSGLHPLTFWLSTFLWDLFNYTIPAVAIMALLFIFGQTPLTANGVWPVSFALLMFYAWAALPFVYGCSYLFRSPVKGYLFVVFWAIVSGIFSYLTIVIVTNTTKSCNDSKPSTTSPCQMWEQICICIFPTYALSNGFNRLYSRVPVSDSGYYYGPVTTTLSPDALPSPVAFDKEAVGINLAGMFVFGIVFWIIVLLIEFDWFRALRTMLCTRSARGVQTYNQPPDEEDVIREKAEVLAMNTSSASVVAKNLTKFYGRMLAVKELNFIVRKGDCFGLLGVNGAGKTSTFEMLAGENIISNGDAFIDGRSIKQNWRKAGRSVGYCPQFDAVIPEMTGSETLTMYARLAGVPSQLINPLVENILTITGVKPHANKKIIKYSGGNKRRLSLGIALIQQPQVLLLDEPTAGVDPKARRLVWNILSELRQRGTAIVLTSHSMEECEALCTRLGIMVAGQFQCLGSPQHIKSKYGLGFTLQIKVATLDVVEQAKQGILEAFPSTALKESHVTQLTFDLPRTNATWSELFSSVERLVPQLNIIDYSLSQTTLEQIFIEFSRRSIALNLSAPLPV
uniref:ABC transporter domain-containing protein n=1 Tax=Plectus sambesii TaxID=2011161 RepID=A0A914WE89_9BILA